MATQYTAGLAAGNILTAAIMNQIGAVSETWTPTWSSTGTAPVLGNGTLTGTYFRLQKLIIAEARLQSGSTTTFGTGAYALSLPVTALAATTPNKSIGIARFNDNSAGNNYNFTAHQTGTNSVSFTVNAGGTWSLNIPVTFANPDFFTMLIVYEAA